MTELTRDFLNGQLSAAVGAKGAGASLNLAGDLVPTVTALDLSVSAWPPFMPFVALEGVTAGAGAFAECFCGLLPQASKFTRMVIDNILVRHNDGATTSVDMGLQSMTGGVRLLQQLDSTLFPEGVGIGSPLPIWAGSNTSAPVGKVLTFGTNATRVLANANTPQSLDLLVVLKPGWFLMLENANAATQLTVQFRGRLYIA